MKIKWNFCNTQIVRSGLKSPLLQLTKNVIKVFEKLLLLLRLETEASRI